MCVDVCRCACVWVYLSTCVCACVAVCMYMCMCACVCYPNGVFNHHNNTYNEFPPTKCELLFPFGTNLLSHVQNTMQHVLICILETETMEMEMEIEIKIIYSTIMIQLIKYCALFPNYPLNMSILLKSFHQSKT